MANYHWKCGIFWLKWTFPANDPCADKILKCFIQDDWCQSAINAFSLFTHQFSMWPLCYADSQFRFLQTFNAISDWRIGRGSRKNDFDSTEGAFGCLYSSQRGYDSILGCRSTDIQSHISCGVYCNKFCTSHDVGRNKVSPPPIWLHNENAKINHCVEIQNKLSSR
jgi:hypothetical protein